MYFQEISGELTEDIESIVTSCEDRLEINKKWMNDEGSKIVLWIRSNIPLILKKTKRQSYVRYESYDSSYAVTLCTITYGLNFKGSLV